MNLRTLERYYEMGLLQKQTHPSLDLTIWNYTPKVQYEELWDDVTIQCRGLITDGSGKVIVRPFKKFFNYEEALAKGTIPTSGDYVYVQEKADGSLGILFNYSDRWIMATRGSFASEQAIRGLEIVKSKYHLDSFPIDYAYLVEIIYPENRIVVDYEGKEGVVFLSVVLNEDSGNWKPTDEPELHWTTANSIFKYAGIKKSDIIKCEQHFSFSDDLYRSLKEKNESNKEGFVLRFQPGNFRMKIKFEEYVRLHKVMTNTSTTGIWELLSSGGKIEDILDDVPDEFFGKIREYSDSLLAEFEKIESDYKMIFSAIKSRETEGAWNRGVFAGYATLYKHPGILFSMLDGRDYTKHIWKLIRPEFRKL